MPRVVFEEIRDMGSIDSRRLRELLPTRMANRGFPDFDLRRLLAPYEVSEKEIDHLFESALQLLDLSSPDEERRGDQPPPENLPPSSPKTCCGVFFLAFFC